MSNFKNIGIITARQNDLKIFLEIHKNKRFLTEAEFGELASWLREMSGNERIDWIAEKNAQFRAICRKNAIDIGSPTDDRTAMHYMEFDKSLCRLMDEPNNLVTSQYVVYWQD